MSEPTCRVQLLGFGFLTPMCGRPGTHHVRTGCRHEHIFLDGWVCEDCWATAGDLLCGDCWRGSDRHECRILVEEITTVPT